MTFGFLGMLTIDTLLACTELPLGPESISSVEHRDTSLGGKGLIAAAACAALGGDTALFGLVGTCDEDYHFILARIPRSISCDYLVRGLTRNHAVTACYDATGKAYYYVELGNLEPNLSSLLQAKLTKFLAAIEVLYVGAESTEVLGILTQLLPNFEGPVVANPSLAMIRNVGDMSSIHEILRACSTLVFNEFEASVLLSELGATSWRDVALPRLKNIVITKGISGGESSIFPFANWKSYSAGSSSRGICCIGAGDTFAGALTKKLYGEYLELGEACQESARVAGLKCGLHRSHITMEKVNEKP